MWWSHWSNRWKARWIDPSLFWLPINHWRRRSILRCDQELFHRSNQRYQSLGFETNWWSDILLYYNSVGCCCHWASHQWDSHLPRKVMRLLQGKPVRANLIMPSERVYCRWRVGLCVPLDSFTIGLSWLLIAVERLWRRNENPRCAASSLPLISHHTGLSYTQVLLANLIIVISTPVC